MGSRLVVLSVVAASLGLFGCKGGEKPAAPQAVETKKAAKIGIVYDSGGLGDKSFNDSAARGIEKAKSELGVEVIQIESKDVKDYEANLREVSNKGCDLVVAVGINMMKATETVSTEFPDVKFAIIDAAVEKPNVRSLLFKEEEGSFLVGYLAGLMTKSNKIGFVGGMDIPLIRKFEAGYVAGAETANPKVSLLPSKFTGDWNKIDDAKVAANLLYSQGADVVYHAAGRAGLGVIRAAAENKKFAIGVDSDQDGEEPGWVLTSMIKRVDVAVFSTIKDVVDGKFSAGSTTYDLKADGVGVSPMTHTKDKIGQENLDKLNAVTDKIRSGELVVPASQEDLVKFREAAKSAA